MQNNSGWIKQHRKEKYSAIFTQPPLYYKVWQWLKMSVDRQTGVLRTSYGLIAEAVGWCERGLFRAPNKKTIRSILAWMEGNGMIVVQSNAAYTEISIRNWATYQHRDSEKVTPNGPPKVTGDSTKVTPNGPPQVTVGRPLKHSKQNDLSCNDTVKVTPDTSPEVTANGHMTRSTRSTRRGDIPASKLVRTIAGDDVAPEFLSPPDKKIDVLKRALQVKTGRPAYNQWQIQSGEYRQIEADTEALIEREGLQAILDDIEPLCDQYRQNGDAITTLKAFLAMRAKERRAVEEAQQEEQIPNAASRRVYKAGM